MGLIGVIAPFRLEVGFGLASIFFKDFFFSSFGCKGESLKIFLRTIIQNRFSEDLGQTLVLIGRLFQIVSVLFDDNMHPAVFVRYA